MYNLCFWLLALIDIDNNEIDLKVPQDQNTSLFVFALMNYILQIIMTSKLHFLPHLFFPIKVSLQKISPKQDLHQARWYIIVIIQPELAHGEGIAGPEGRRAPPRFLISGQNASKILRLWRHLREMGCESEKENSNSILYIIER